MRLRHIKNADEIIKGSSYIIINPEHYKGKWQKVFHNNYPLHIEIGIGKGKFIKEMALKHPNINFIGIEKYSTVLIKAIQRLEDTNISNLKLICADALNISDFFDREIDHVYLNFSDPWPKDRHAKRRLTSDIFLSLYDNIFKGDNNITQKTDNYDLFNYSKDQFLKHKYEICISEYNINNLPSDNVMTEYEEKFIKMNNLIYKIIAVKGLNR